MFKFFDFCRKEVQDSITNWIMLRRTDHFLQLGIINYIFLKTQGKSIVFDDAFNSLLLTDQNGTIHIRALLSYKVHFIFNY